MDLQLGGKRALVTGSSSGIGAGIARRMAGEGATVVVHGRNAARAAAVAETIKSAGGKAIVALGDLSSNEGAGVVAAQAQEQLSGIDILVNNAGGSVDASVTWDTTMPEHWLGDYEMNAVAAFRMIKHFLPGMKERGWGRIIQISSTQAGMPNAHTTPAYAAAKAGMVAMTVALSKTLAGKGITVNTVTPGPVDSAALREFILQRPAYKGKTFEEVELQVAKNWNVTVGRLGVPDDLAVAVTFLSSPLAGFITGTNLRVDGGMCGFTNV